MPTVSRLALAPAFATFLFLLFGCATYEAPVPAIKNLPNILGSSDDCSLSSDQASLESHGTIRLLTFADRRTVFSDLRSGRTLTIDALLERTSTAFAAAAGAPSGKQLGKIGAASHGGEAVFVADGRGGLAVVFNGNPDDAAVFNAEHVRALQQLMVDAR